MNNMKCFEMGFASLLDVTLWIKWASILANIAAVVTAIIAFFAALVAYKQLISNKKESGKNIAYNIYHQYLLLCINNPTLSKGIAKPATFSLDFEKYKWFVSAMLLAFEQIIESQKNDNKWRATIKSQLLIHKEFLKVSRTVRDKEWDEELHKIIEEVIS
ncbi:hypothetical protein N4Q63_15110 [Leclercia adecarboxylata]|uniref:Uncharacterized protein n=2 Tax=Pseudomonadati TaxID=3379134 RepID=A0A9X3YBB7_9ENTR|nr:hypothetical protein [Leclercia adecarboxylata]MDC6623156.1 hypothetical protein [Leclercia adecarboxylata]MDC6633747.1 hypothetical protein [Leclercia adecarboxylata]MDC6639358.1 hypothetical protein [Leclercia adecarboxylata]MDC6649516.1 hypothetical protein [Leclercia adecarboxylata]MDC6655307.1 hypothetical protein [Leclercia adecarboxylata]